MRSTSIIAAWLALVWERSAAIVWPAALAPGAYAAIALFGVWERLGDPWRAVALGLAICWAIGFATRGVLSGGWPNAAAAHRRLEEDAGLADRPFEALEDVPVQAGPETNDVWRAHQARMAERLRGARARRPKAAYAAADPAGLRIMLALLAIAGFAAAGGDAGARLGLAFAPHLLEGGADAAVVEAWIDPPTYTGRAPIYLGPAGEAAAAPTGSKVVMRLTGMRRAPRLVLASEDAKTRLKPQSSEAGAHMYAFDLVDDVTLRLAAGRERVWPITAEPDQAPEVAFAETPEVGEKQLLNLKISASDDYGVEAVVLRVTRRDEGSNGETSDHPLELPVVRTLKNEAAAIDLTQHPWAGLEVSLTLVARDAAGGEGVSAPAYMALPERVFAEPLAKALQEQRRGLIRLEADYAPEPGDDADPVRFAEDAAAIPPLKIERARAGLDRAPQVVDRAHAATAALAMRPELFATDVVVQLGLDYVSERLALARSRSDLDDLPDVFWDLALRAEGGDLADAERAMREAQQALARALARGAPQEEIDQLSQRYREAVNRYLDLLRQEAIEAGRVEMMAGGAAGGEMGVDQLQEMLRTLEELAQTGSREDARRLLNALSEMLQNLEMTVAMGAGGSGSPMDADSEELREALEDLADLIGEQRELMDDTLDRREGRDGDGDGDESEDGAASPGQSSPGQSSPGASAGTGGPQSPEFGQGAADLAERQARLADALNALAERLAQENAANGENPGASGENPGAGGAEPGASGEDQGAGSGADGERDGAGGYALDDDGRFMDFAEQALRDGDLSGALDAQGEALERLRQAAEGLAREAMARSRNAQAGQGQAGQDPTSQPTRIADPFGRTTGGLGVGDDVDVPTEMERRRARDILDLLRERLGDTDRSDEEHDYLERLLDAL